jgi:transposase-like protein
VLERALAEELADHLVYDIGDSARAWIGSRKEAAERLVTDAASIDLEVPRERRNPRTADRVQGQPRFDVSTTS